MNRIEMLQILKSALTSIDLRGNLLEIQYTVDRDWAYLQKYMLILEYQFLGNLLKQYAFE